MARAVLPALAALAALTASVAQVACAPARPPDAAARADLEDPDAEADTAATNPRLAGDPGPTGPVVWLDSEKQALERGRTERRPILVHFDSDWCADCSRFKKETLGDPRVEAEAGRFVAVRIDATEDDDPQISAVLQKYTVINVPTLILLDFRGREQRRITELVGPETFLHEMDQIR
ncbi:MAG: thioredoxin family protein [Polyangiaceae bacterium]